MRVINPKTKHLHEPHIEVELEEKHLYFCQPSWRGILSETLLQKTGTYEGLVSSEFHISEKHYSPITIHNEPIINLYSYLLSVIIFTDK